MKPKTVRNALLVAMVVWGGVLALEVVHHHVSALTVIAFLGAMLGAAFAHLGSAQS